MFPQKTSFPTDFSGKFRPDRYNYKVESITRSDEATLRNGGSVWGFTIVVVTSSENTGRLATALMDAAPGDFEELTFQESFRFKAVVPEKIDSRSVPAGYSRMKELPLSETSFVLKVYEEPNWVDRNAPITTPEELLGFPTVGEDLTLEELLDVLVPERARPEPYQPQYVQPPEPYQPQYVQPGTEIGYVQVPDPRERLSQVDAVLPPVQMSRSEWEYLQNEFKGPKDKPEKKPEPKEKEPPRNRVIRQRRGDEKKVPNPRVVRRIIKRR